MDIRAGTETALAHVVKVFGAALLHTDYLFAHTRAKRVGHERIKTLIQG
jgi:hypothetical protein